jgi:hypothetical protein
VKLKHLVGSFSLPQMIDKSIWSISSMKTDMGNPMFSDRNLSQCHYFNTCHLDRAGIEIGAPATRNWVVATRGMSHLTWGRGRSRSCHCRLSAVEVQSICCEGNSSFLPFRLMSPNRL